MSDQGPSERRTELIDPVIVMAFAGWNDASCAASSCLLHLIETTSAKCVYTMNGDDYYDYQVSRPQVQRDSPTEARYTWPETTVSLAQLPGTAERPGRDIVLITGPEPNLRWRAFIDRLMAVITELKPTLVVMLGALLSDCPHTRPVPVSGSTLHPKLLERHGLELPDYEGPTGIVGLLADACATAEMPTVSLWAALPHYVAHPPNPKATLALLMRLEDVIGLPLEVGDLPELARAWQRGVEELAADDNEIADYVAQLETAQDDNEIPDASGDAIAAEFERYLRRRDA